MQNKSKTRRNVLMQCFVVFIALSASVQAEPLQCYWCGPLAEQVHRSQRAPPCDEVTNLVTSCDPGYDYCAVIASSPPLVESRLCVKLYQDECYHVYCNTSRTWRMTCPCRGDLCNGPNMEREKEAFTILTALVEKTRSPIKKRSAHLEDSNSIQNSSHHDVKDIKHNLTGVDVEKTTERYYESMITPTTLEMIKNEINSNIVTPTLYPVTEEKKENERSKEQMQSDQPRTDDSNVKREQPKDTFDIVLKTSDEVTTMSVNGNKATNAENKVSNASINKDVDPGHQTKENETTLKKGKQENTQMSDVVKSNANIPPAQALLQDSNPVTVTEKTGLTITTLMMETQTMVEESTTKAIKNSKNNAVGICLHLILIVKWIALYIRNFF